MLLFDDSKKLEKALGEEAASVIAHVFEKADDKWRQDLATKAELREARHELATRADVLEAKADLREARNELLERIAAVRVEMQAMRGDLVERIAAAENRTLRWMVGGFITQTALLVAILAFLR